MVTRYWLMKTEPDEFSIDDLARKKRAPWDGVRNYQARNHMKAMHVGDEVLFYHSSCATPGVAGLAKIGREAYPDPSAWNPKSKYFDAKTDPASPRWWMVDVLFVEKFPGPVTLDSIKADTKCEGMLVRCKGSRLSVQPVEARHFKRIKEMAYVR